MQFNSITSDSLDIVDDSIIGFDDVKHVFSLMAGYLYKYFDIPVLDIERLIKRSAYNWQEKNNITFTVYRELSLPETLILADQMKKEVLNTISPFLQKNDDYIRLKEIAERALLYYMQEVPS